METADGGERRADLDVDPELQARLRALRQKEQEKEALRRQVWKERRVLLPLLGITLALLPNFRMAQVQGRSMYPAYTEGDRLVMLKTFKYFSPVKVGDVVVIRLKDGKYKGEEWVKRVVFIQNEQGDAPWPQYIGTFRGDVPTQFLFPQYVLGLAKVPPGHIMVMGDNLLNSTDSRDEEIGPISTDEIVGKVLNN
jgi:signal peptidase I